MKFSFSKITRVSLIVGIILTFIFFSETFTRTSYSNNVSPDYGLINADSVKTDTTGHFYKEEMVDSLIAKGRVFLGLKYKYGGRTPAGFDCSGYVSYLYGQFGYTLPTSSSAMAFVGEDIPYKEARKGDIILFKGRNTSAKYVGHVALIIGVDSLGVTMMHSCQRGVLIDRYPQMDYYRVRYMGIRRVKL